MTFCEEGQELFLCNYLTSNNKLGMYVKELGKELTISLQLLNALAVKRMDRCLTTEEICGVCDMITSDMGVNNALLDGYMMAIDKYFEYREMVIGSVHE